MMSVKENIPHSVQKVIQLIVDLAKPQKLMLFGSRAKNTSRVNSDFDLAIFEKGCSEEEWNSLLVKLDDEALTLFSIDLVEFERLEPLYQENILKEGMVLYERNNKF